MTTKVPNGRNKKTDIRTVDYGKVPPQALELEESILGAIMIEQDAFARVSDLLKADYFYTDAHQKIFQAITSLYTNDKSVDMFTVTEELRKRGQLEDVGGQFYIANLTANVASAAHLENHAHIIAQKYISRELIRISTDIQSKAFEEKEDVEDVLQDAESQIFEISQSNLKRDFTQIDPVVKDAIAHVQQAAKQKEGYSGVPSGFHSLDKMTSGWQNSDLIIIAARPAMGKTAFVLSMAKNIGVDQEIPCAIFSLEMSNLQLVNRLIVNVCHIPGEKIKTGQLEQHEWAQLDHKVKALEGAPIFVDDTPSLSITELRTKARRLVKDHAVKIIFIDYLQLMNAQGMNFYSREQEVSLISRSLKGLAKELNIPIIALSQLNRGVENRGNAGSIDGKKPQLSDLRESGAIEQDADIVCFIHRPEYYKIFEDPSTHKDLHGIAQIIVAKHRNGSTGEVDLLFKSEYVSFMNEDADVDPYAGMILNSKTNGKVDHSNVDYGMPGNVPTDFSDIDYSNNNEPPF